ncbi:hypothetical protein [Microbispora sp. NBRC 16548]|uniref:hypothetical protein n=1 Tax=Microbispora sp. NBRC 16548 TaxID=3030994 RepID=UPI0024A215CD|nr:hypothetical protein [Microbispora sp. NBRC 16548]GLX08022.1 hypothetical protein Misp03_49480 [Microbispora sp. NBRC 16548]
MGLRTPAAVVLALLSLAACSPGGPPGPENLAARVNPLPAGVEGHGGEGPGGEGHGGEELGAAVFLARVPDETRDDMLGLIRVGRFGDELPKGTWVRRHVEVALGDPAAPIAVRGLAGDPRDAVLVSGDVVDATLPAHVFVEGTFPVGPTVSATTGRCLLVRTDGRIEQPGPEAQCERAPNGGVYWYGPGSTDAGGVDLRDGTATPRTSVPAFPVAVSPDGRHLASLRDDALVITDTRDGTPVTVGRSSRGAPGAFTGDGYATILRQDDGASVLAVAGVHGEVRRLVDDVGTAAFTPDGRRALAMAGRARPRLVVADLRTGTLTPVKGFPADDGSVKIAVAGEHALVAVLARNADIGDPKPAEVWDVDLRQARARRAVTVPRARQAVPLPATPRGGQPAGPGTDTPGVTGIRFAPDGVVVALTSEGVTAAGPPGAFLVTALPGRRILFSRDTRDAGDGGGDGGGGGGGDSGDDGDDGSLTVVSEPGAAVRIATGARKGQAVDRVLPTADGRHLIVSLRPRDSLRAGPGPDHEIVLARLDGGAPLVLYRGVVLASVGL